MDRRKPVLIVEDDALTRQSVARRLTRRGYEVLGAASGEEALDLASGASDLHAVLLDIELPGIDGIETCCRLRQIHPLVPIVVCSGCLTPAVRQQLSALGVTTLLEKPCPGEKLLGAIESV